MGQLSPNAFEIFSSEQIGAENHLTRGLLVLLRLSPLAHEVWLRQIGLGRDGLTRLGEPTYAFQTGKVPGIDRDAEARGISVFITREEPYNRGPIEPSQRRQIPDALITYQRHNEPVVVVIESKVRTAADERQAREINLGITVRWDPDEPVELRWASLVDELWALVDLGLVAASERQLLLDFFDYVDNRYREVGPYSTIARCGRIPGRLVRRCRALLEEATELEAVEPTRGSPYVEPTGVTGLRRVIFGPVDNALRLACYLGDTMTQARELYPNPEMCERLFALASKPGWTIAPNMHFGHMESGQAWTPVRSDITAGDYVAYWQKHGDLIQMYYRPGGSGRDWDSLLSQLLADGMIASRDPFDHDIAEKGWTQAQVRPGLFLGRDWSIEDSEPLDETHVLVQEVRAVFQQILSL